MVARFKDTKNTENEGENLIAKRMMIHGKGNSRRRKNHDIRQLICTSDISN